VPAALIAGTKTLHRSYTRQRHEHLASQSRRATHNRSSKNINQRSHYSRLKSFLLHNADTDVPSLLYIARPPSGMPSPAPVIIGTSGGFRAASILMHVTTGDAFMGLTYLASTSANPHTSRTVEPAFKALPMSPNASNPPASPGPGPSNLPAVLDLSPNQCQ